MEHKWIYIKLKSQLDLKAYAQPYHLPFSQHGPLLIIALHKPLTARKLL